MQLQFHDHIKTIIGVLCIWLLAGCSAKKYLAEGESYLFRNSVRIKSEKKIEDESELKLDLETLYKQKETESVIGIPKHWFYYKTQNNPDSSSFKRWIRKNFGAPPVIYNERLAEQTSGFMERYLDQRGYRMSDVHFEAKTTNRETTVRYTADPGNRLTIDRMILFSRDSAVQQVLEETSGQALLRDGSPLDIRLFNLERSRISRTLQDRGYAFFFENYISNIEMDTSGRINRAVMEVLNPTDTTLHEIYRNGHISVYLDYNLADTSAFLDTLIEGVTFFSPGLPLLVNPKVILRNLYIREGEIYSKRLINQTSRQLGKLEIYKFASIKPVIDTIRENTLNYQIFLTRNKKSSIGGDGEINYSTIAAARRNLVGIAGNVSYRHRNLFHGAENFSSTLEGGAEINLTRQADFFNSTNVTFNNVLDIPGYIDPVRFYDRLSSIRIGKNNILGNNFNRWLKEESRSTVTVGLSFFDLVNFYRYFSFNSAIGYDIQPEPNKRIQVNQFGFNYFNPEIREQFQAILDNNQFLAESFGKQLFTGFLFRDYSYTLNRQPNRAGWAWGINHGLEISGAEILFANQLYNAIASDDVIFQLRGKQDTTEFSQFLKFELQYTLRKEFGPNSSLAFKFHTGLAFPFGPYSRQVPYVKQFFAGGALSNRAWIIRELGPGGYEDPNPVINPRNPFYQSGDILLDMSLEYRFKLFWRFHSAIFLDAANVWTIKEDPERPEANFTGKFIDQIALGYGFGFRIDFTYFFLRLDFGYKLRSPYPLENGSHWYPDAFSQFPRNGNPNFAVNYPF